MRTVSILVLTIISFSSVCGQKKVAKPEPTDNKVEEEGGFQTQGEQEDYWAKELFKKKYKKQKFERYQGSIQANAEGTFTYDDKVFRIVNTDQKLLPIFKNGILYPNIITGSRKDETKSKLELDKMTQDQRMLYNLTRTDSLTISNFEELAFLSKSPKYKRFRFLLFRKGSFNPIVYFIELTNKRALPTTDQETFINGSILTFCEQGWMQI